MQKQTSFCAQMAILGTDGDGPFLAACGSSIFVSPCTNLRSFVLSVDDNVGDPSDGLDITEVNRVN